MDFVVMTSFFNNQVKFLNLDTNGCREWTTYERATKMTKAQAMSWEAVLGDLYSLMYGDKFNRCLLWASEDCEPNYDDNPF